MKRLVNHMQLRPHESTTESSVTASKAHFRGPFTMKSERMKSIITSAPA